MGRKGGSCLILLDESKAKQIDICRDRGDYWHQVWVERKARKEISHLVDGLMSMTLLPRLLPGIQSPFVRANPFKLSTMPSRR